MYFAAGMLDKALRPTLWRCYTGVKSLMPVVVGDYTFSKREVVLY